MRAERMEKRKEVDFEKLGEDVVYLAKDGKFAEIELLREQMDIPTRQMASVLGAVLIKLEHKHGRADESKLESFNTAGTGPMLVTGFGAALLGAGTIPAGLAGLAAGLIMGARRGEMIKNIRALKELKECLEK